MRLYKMIKSGFLWTFRFFLLGVLLLLTNHFYIKWHTNDKTYHSINNIPFNQVGLVLGTSKKVKSGQINLYYKYRIEATSRLYKNKKIEYVLISGDNRSKYYNEPKQFKEDLMKMGIPENRIFLDPAGLRTLDSVVRAKKVFKLENITIISQRFHNERAIYIADCYGMKAIGYNAKDVPIAGGFKVQVRELLAKAKMMIDLHLLKKQPKFLGEQTPIIKS